MNDYVIVTDSSVDLPFGLIKKLKLQILPLQFFINDRSYFNHPDERDLPLKDFYNLVRKGAKVTTAQVNVDRFLNKFEEILSAGKDVLYISFSSALSGTFNSATIAANELQKKYPNQKIILVDSLSASMGEGLLCYHAIMKKNNGISIEDLATWLNDNKLNLCHWFTVDDLFHLKRGGRVSSMAAIMGTALGIKPVLHVDDDGNLVPVQKVRGRKQALNSLVEHMEKTCFDPKNQVVFISHGDCIDDARYVANLIDERLHPKEIKINTIGPVIGAHSGPGTVALFFLGSKR